MRNRNNLRLNENMYRIFAMPLYRLALSSYSQLTPQDQASFIRDARKQQRKFLNVPRNTSTETINAIAGNIEHELKRQHDLVKYKTIVHFRLDSPRPEL